MRIRLIVGWLLWLIVPCICSVAQEEKLTIDPAKSEVHFTLEDPLHAVHGTFQLDSGSILFDRKTGTMSGAVAVNAGSGNSGNSSRDKKMTSDELKAKDYRSVTFAPKRFTGQLGLTGDSSITVNGTFTLLGTPHEISVPMQVHLADGQCKATGSFPIPYVEWGMKDPSNFLLKVGKQVTIELVLVGGLASGHLN